ncbi:hypothetical protein KC349_g5384 [Hortaea werneckii]|nr:hypothetical protein KC349_g5384 [Hortaea werneckii]
MSAACLAWEVPQIRESFPSFESRAGTAIVQRLSRIDFTSAVIADDDVTEILFAIFALGTSLHWARPSRYDDTLYNTARSLLALWESHSVGLTPLRLPFFQQAMTYWEMLLSASKSDFSHAKLVERRRNLQERQWDSANAYQSLLDGQASLQLCGYSSASPDSRPNSSCGISSEVIELFGQVLALCRSAYPRQKRAIRIDRLVLDETDHDLAIGRDLQRELLRLDFDSIVQTAQLSGVPLETGDKSTPLAHHIYAAEAYRLASLLQLRMFFEAFGEAADVDSAAFGPSSSPQGLEGDSGVLAERLINILQLIPLDSGLRCTQLVLCISAAAGLKHSPFQTAEISDLRNVILSRLDMLQRNLPVRPVKVTAELIKAIWTAYDDGTHTTAAIHWLDIVEGYQFQTLLC